MCPGAKNTLSCLLAYSKFNVCFVSQNTSYCVQQEKLSVRDVGEQKLGRMGFLVYKSDSVFQAILLCLFFFFLNARN